MHGMICQEFIFVNKARSDPKQFSIIQEGHSKEKNACISLY